MWLAIEICQYERLSKCLKVLLQCFSQDGIVSDLQRLSVVIVCLSPLAFLSVSLTKSAPLCLCCGSTPHNLSLVLVFAQYLTAQCDPGTEREVTENYAEEQKDLRFPQVLWEMTVLQTRLISSALNHRPLAAYMHSHISGEQLMSL